MPIDRKTAPELSIPEHVEFIDPEKGNLENGIPVYMLDGGSQEVSRIEFYFRAGTAYQDKPLQAEFTNYLLNAGTSKMEADDISARLDYYGAYFKTDVTRDWFKVSVFSMNRFLDKVLPIVADILMDSIFPVDELEILRKNKYEKFRVDSQKVKTLARREFARRMFGKHPYSQTEKDDDFKNISQDDCREFYEKLIHPGNCEIFVSGNVHSDMLDTLNSTFGQWTGPSGYHPRTIAELQDSPRAEYIVTKKDAVQTAIRMGRTVIDRRHKDHTDLRILNTIFGGYFGSRLMSNIREDKGYTYGISSTIATEQHASYMLLTTEVGAQYTEATLTEIHKEMDRLRNEDVPTNELNLVKNYIVGTLLKSSDGPFAMADRFKSMHFFGLDYKYYDQFMRRTKSITPAELRKAAQKYMDHADFLTVIAKPGLNG